MTRTPLCALSLSLSLLWTPPCRAVPDADLQRLRVKERALAGVLSALESQLKTVLNIPTPKFKPGVNPAEVMNERTALAHNAARLRSLIDKVKGELGQVREEAKRHGEEKPAEDPGPESEPSKETGGATSIDDLRRAGIPDDLAQDISQAAGQAAGGAEPPGPRQSALDQGSLGRAGDRAASLGAALKAGVDPSAGDLPPGGSQKGAATGAGQGPLPETKAGGIAAEAAGAIPQEAAGGPSFNAASPSRPEDFALAAGPFRQAFSDLGLKVGPGPAGRPALLRADGGPASSEETEQLRGRISAMPKALIQDPNYLSPQIGGIAPQRFADLKAAVETRPDLKDREFKHVGASEDKRDLARTQSCRRVSRECNELAEKDYKKGEAVPARDLNKIWDRINRGQERLAKAEERARQLRGSRARLGDGLARRIGRLLGAAGALFGGSSRGTSDSQETLGYEAASAASVQGGLPAREQRTGRSPARGSGGDVASGPESPQARGSAMGKLWPWLLAAVLILAPLLRRRRREEP